MSQKITLLSLLYLGLCSVEKHKAVVDTVPSSLGSTAILQCYTYGAGNFPWPQYHERNNNFTTVWMKDGQVLDVDNKFNITSTVTYNFCDTFSNTAKQYTSASGLELPENGTVNKNFYDIYSGFACFVSTLTIQNVEASDFNVYQCNYSDHRLDVRSINFIV